jgi:hypothetical protein
MGFPAIRFSPQLMVIVIQNCIASEKYKGIDNNSKEKLQLMIK